MAYPFEFHEEFPYVFCPYCQGKVQALKEVETEEGETKLADDEEQRLAATKHHFATCNKEQPYLEDQYATYPETT